MSQAPSDLADGVPFSFFCSLLREISRAASHKPLSSHSYWNPNYPALNIFRRWTDRLRKDFSPLPPGTSGTVFKLLFPDEDHHRKFDLQETRLSQHLAGAFGIEKAQLESWILENASGCLGEELRLALQRTSTTVDGHICSFSIAQVDELLDELASTSGYTDSRIRQKYPPNKRRARLPIIKDLFRTLSPIDASFLTQIILKDLRPILYPLRETHYIACLLGENSASVKMLSRDDAMNIWDPSKYMLNAYRVKSAFEEAANEFEKNPNERSRNVPKIGVPVAIPKSQKGRSPRHALQYFCSGKTGQWKRREQQVWAETKYDGERAQIHVEVRPQETKITIFSKSKRDSTKDRIIIHDVINRALGLTKDGVTGQSRLNKNVILDAEMVVFEGEKVDEFWKIKGLIEETAIGIRSKKRVRDESQVDSDSYSMITSNSHTLQMGLVFFDILSLDSESLLMQPYRTRRSILEDLIHATPGECILSHRVAVGVGQLDNQDDSQLCALEKKFAESIATFEEGLVLKGEETVYHDFYHPWVKLKRDYIPGYGDTIDMVIVGVTWERERARKLRVPPSTMTTFYIGGVENSDEIKRQPSLRPHLQVYFTVSYGLTRSQLEDINFLIRNSETVSYSSSMKSNSIPYTFSVLPSLAPPRYILKTPLLAELYGDRFTKAPKSRHYELRFPRVTKIHRTSDRPWTEGLNLKELHKVACASVGRDTSEKEARDITAEMWGKTASPGARSASKRKATRDLWLERLAELDGRAVEHNDEESQPSSPSPSPLKRPLPLNRSHLSLPSGKRLCISQSGNLDDMNQPSENVSRPLRTTTNVMISQKSVTSETPFSPPSTPQRAQKSNLKLNSGSRVVSGHINTRFLDNALVWFAKPRGESWMVRNVVSRGQRVHSVEAFLAGCGWWPNSGGAKWATKGVVFVDLTSIEGKNMTQSTVDMIQDRLRKAPACQTRKPLWIFEQNQFHCPDALTEDMKTITLYYFE